MKFTFLNRRSRFDTIRGAVGPIPYSARFASQSTDMRPICAVRFREKSQKGDVRLALHRPRQRWTVLPERDPLK